MVFTLFQLKTGLFQQRQWRRQMSNEFWDVWLTDEPGAVPQHKYAYLSHPKTLKVKSETRNGKQKDDLLPASKENISFNIVAYSRLIRKHSQDIALTGCSMVNLVFDTNTAFLFFLPPRFPHSLISLTKVVLFYRGKKSFLCADFAYLFRLTYWMLLKTPWRPRKHSFNPRASTFLLTTKQVRCCPDLSAIFLFFYFIIMFGLFVYLEKKRYIFIMDDENSLSSASSY